MAQHKPDPWSVAQPGREPGDVTYATQIEAFNFVAGELELGGTDRLHVYRRADDGWSLYKEYEGSPLTPEAVEFVAATAAALGDEWSVLADGSAPEGAWWAQPDGFTAWLVHQSSGHFAAVAPNRQRHHVRITLWTTAAQSQITDFPVDLRTPGMAQRVAGVLEGLLTGAPSSTAWGLDRRLYPETTVADPSDVTSEVLGIVQEIVDYWFPQGAKIDWAWVWGRSDDIELQDGTSLSIGEGAEKTIRRIVAANRAPGAA